ncbi:amidase [Agrococcus sp. ARC_14]|uniref:amidase n=1 Tax=Agrococcus sp. ARC_14 TaxID=2919927 RepID=UPI001F0572C8|nr:amidase [Agrococcus sp. ARC_14]MCH1883749.1 amidase [Agrococcus sp. ARC_14]
MSEIHEIGALELWRLLHARELSAAQVAEHLLDRVERLDAANAFVHVDAELALERARAADAAADRTGIIHGLPFADKDLTPRAGQPASMGSRWLDGTIAAQTHPLAQVLDDGGGVVLGRTAAPEFGFAGYTRSALHGATTMPGHPELHAGGSSGGAAAAVAQGLLPFAPGSDGGGSIRIPAATCGLVGLKPTRGRIPAQGGVGVVGGLATAGAIARSVIDVALLTDALIGRVNGVAAHALSLRAPEHDEGSLLAAAMRGEGRFRIAVMTGGTPWDSSDDIRIAPEATAAVEEAVRALGALGHEIGEVALPDAAGDLGVAGVAGYPAAFTDLWRGGAATIPIPREDRALLEPLARWIIETSDGLSAGGLARAQLWATEFERRVLAAFSPWDAVLTPTTALTPRPLDWYPIDDGEADFRAQVLHTPHTSFANLTGLPAITLPVHQTAEGMPMGVQLIGRPGEEATLLAIGRQLERRVPWTQRVVDRMP